MKIHRAVSSWCYGKARGRYWLNSGFGDDTQLHNPRRVAVGLDQTRLSMLLAVLHRHRVWLWVALMFLSMLLAALKC